MDGFDSRPKRGECPPRGEGICRTGKGGGTKTAAGRSRAQAVGVSGSRRPVGYAFADRFVYGFGCHEDGDADVEGAGGADR